MATATLVTRLELGPQSAGMLLSPEEFDESDFEEGWRYELINEVLVVAPAPLRKERDPNEELGHLLRTYRDIDPEGSALDATFSEETIRLTRNRRRADHAIWAGLGRLPTADDPPTILVEFVSSGKRNRKRDNDTKRAEYGEIGTREYWIFDRFSRTLLVVDFTANGAERTFVEGEIYRTPLLPGFELPIALLFALADRWPEGDGENAP